MTWTKEDIIKVLHQAEETPRLCLGQVQYKRIVYKMLQSLYKRQTDFEQEAEMTAMKNNVGFNGFDAAFLSGVAKASQRYETLTFNQTVVVARRLKKYAGQLAEIAASKAKPVLDSYPKGTDAAIPLGDERVTGDVPLEKNPDPAMPEICTACEAGTHEDDTVLGTFKCDCLCHTNPDIFWSNEFGKRELEQERQAFLADMLAQDAMEKEAGY